MIRSKVSEVRAVSLAVAGVLHGCSTDTSLMLQQHTQQSVAQYVGCKDYTCEEAAARRIHLGAVNARNVASAERDAADAGVASSRAKARLVREWGEAIVSPVIGISEAGANVAGAYANATVNRRSEHHDDALVSAAHESANQTSTIRLPDGPLSLSYSNTSLNNAQGQSSYSHGGYAASGSYSSADADANADAENTNVIDTEATAINEAGDPETPAVPD